MKKIRCLLCVLWLTGCATQPWPSEDLSDFHMLPGKAVLLAQNDHWAKSLVPLQVQVNASFHKLNGRKIAFDNSERLEVRPGKNTVLVDCSFRRGTVLHLTNRVKVDHVFEAGKVYFFSVDLLKGTCGIALESYQ